MKLANYISSLIGGWAILYIIGIVATASPNITHWPTWGRGVIAALMLAWACAKYFNVWFGPDEDSAKDIQL